MPRGSVAPLKRSLRFRADRAGVSPVIATILLVAITVVLAAVLYVMITGIMTPVGEVDVIGLTVSSFGENWSVNIVTVSPGKLPQSTFVVIRDPNASLALPQTPWSKLTPANWTTYRAQYQDGSPAILEIRPGDVLLVSRIAYPAGSTIIISDNTKILATRVL